MAQNEARKQKQLAKKKAKRTEKRTQLARQHSTDPTIRLAGAAHWPIVAALVPENLWTSGLGQLIIARRAPNGEIAFAVFLVDVYCLGVKNAFWNIRGTPDYREMVERMEQHGEFREVSPEHFAKLVLGAVDYAQSFGFSPHVDFRHARRLLEGIDSTRCADRFKFGQDGKPFYINGPHESPERARLIAARIKDAGGHFLIGVEKSSLEAMEAADQFDAEMLEESEFDDEWES